MPGLLHASETAEARPDFYPLILDTPQFYLDDSTWGGAFKVWG